MKRCKNEYTVWPKNISRYGSVHAGWTKNPWIALWWSVSWRVLEIIRAAKLNKHHYGNIFAFGSKLTDSYGRILTPKTK